MSSSTAPGDGEEALAQVLLDGREPRLTPRRAVLTGLAVLLAAALLLWGIPALTGASWSEILGVLGRAPVPVLAGLVGIAVLVLLIDAIGLVAAIPGLRYRDAVRADAVTTAVALGVPGGGTIALLVLYALLRRVGIARGPLVLGALLTSLVDVGAACLLPAIGVLAYLLSGAHVLPTGAVGVLGVLAILSIVLMALAILVTRGPALPRLVEGVADGLGSLPVGPAPEQAQEVGEAVVAGRDGALDLLRRRPLGILLPPLAVRSLQAIALVLALRGAGLEVPLAITIAVFALGRLLAMLPLTPGGAGITEAGTAGALVALGQPAAAAGAAALLVSLTTLLTPLALGVIGALAGAARRRNEGPAGNDRSAR